jgi:putative cardiolipin synthase
MGGILGARRGRGTAALVILLGVAGAALLSCRCTAPATATVHLPRAASAADAFTHLRGAGGPTGVVLLEDNALAWAARWSLVSTAQERIELGTFIYDDDVFGRALLGALLWRAMAGVRVRLLIDGRGSLALSTPGLGRDELSAIVATGGGRIDVHVYNPPWNQALAALLSLDATAVSAGSHNKLLVIDDAFAIVGGRNVTAHSFLTLAEDPGAVRDADVLLDGPVPIAAIARIFAREFRSARDDGVDGDRCGAHGRAQELLLLAAAMDVWVRGQVPLPDDERAPTLAEHGTMLAALAAQRLGVVVEQAEPGTRLQQDLEQLVRFRSVWSILPVRWPPRLPATARVSSTPSRPRIDEDDDANDALLRAIAGARDSIVLETPSFILGPSLLLALQAAGARGVDITVLTNGPRSSDSRFAQALFIDSWPELVARIPRLRIFAARAPQMQHGKRIVVDEALAFVGTFNLDPFSTQMNSETVVAMWSPALASSIRATLRARRTEMDEYRIARHADGRARRHPPGTARAGGVIVEFGPRDQVDAAEIERIERTKAFLLAIRPLYDFDALIW